MSYQISSIKKADYNQLIDIWEDAMYKTHSFLDKEDIEFLKHETLINLFDKVNIIAIRKSDGTITGFIGVDDRHIEMLFVSPEFSGKGIGSSLLQYAINEMNANSLDVYEENKVALDFYKKVGFKEVLRHEIDDVINKKHPILVMRLE